VQHCKLAHHSSSKRFTPWCKPEVLQLPAAAADQSSLLTWQFQEQQLELLVQQDL
jgi:hypothetical protein